MRRTHYRNAQRTLDRLLELGVLPVVNENDTVATDEIRFGDNDRLAALVAHVTRAGALILLSDVDGLYDGDPRPRRGPAHYRDTGPRRPGRDQARRGGKAGRDAGKRQAPGIGGMATKVEAAMIASAAGIPTVVADAARAVEALSGGAPGPTSRRPGAAGGHPAALAEARRGGPRQPAARPRRGRGRGQQARQPAAGGITGVEGAFDAGDPVNLCDEDGTVVARGLVNYDASEVPGLMGRSTRWLASKLGPEYEREVVHRDDMVILN